jgi:hypothetical protein
MDIGLDMGVRECWPLAAIREQELWQVSYQEDETWLP